MDFALCETAARFEATSAGLATTLRERAAAHEADENVPADVYRELGSHGLMAVHVGASLGGCGAPVTAYAAAMRQIARGCASTAVTMAVTNMVGEVIAQFGTDAQRERYCPQLAKGGLGAFGLSEVGAGSDPAGMRTTATPNDEGYRIDGDKQWISHGDRSEVMVVWALLPDEGITCFLVPRDAPGLEIVRKEDKMGLRASATCALGFDGVQLAKEALLGKPGGGFRVAMMALDGGRIGIASQSLGIGESAYEALAAAAKRRSLGQAAAFALADARTRLDAGWLMTLRAAQLKQEKAPFTREASMAKVFATETAWSVATAASVHVPLDDPDRSLAERALRDVRVTRIYEGTSEIQRHVIARELMRTA